jgi:Cu/Ag efflux pump CusA
MNMVPVQNVIPGAIEPVRVLASIDATGVGWVYQYVVRGAQKNLAELRDRGTRETA